MDDDFKLSPPDGLSESQRQLRTRVVPPVEVSNRMPPRSQFTLRQLLIFTTFSAAGLAGQSWMPADVFAGLLGIGVFLCLIWFAVSPPENEGTRLLWWGLVCAYTMALVTAVLKSFVFIK